MGKIKLNLYINKCELTRQMRNRGYTAREIDSPTGIRCFARWYGKDTKSQMTTDRLWSKAGVFNEFLCRDEYVDTGVTKEIVV